MKKMICPCKNFRIFLIPKCKSQQLQFRRWKKSSSKKYSDTIQLPKTDFPLSMKDGVAAKRELEIQKTAGFSKLYEWQQKQDRDKDFILHDGPPYANGNTHVGHVVNKVLKDITNRFHLLRGYKVHYIPGWDCHGLPIELKAVSGKDAKQLNPLQIREKARKFAETTIKTQKQSFQSWGIMADWEKQAYYTFDPQYQVKEMEIFYQMYEKGCVYRGFMPVYFSPSSRTALAEAELEYNPEHISTAVYVKFPVISLPSLSDFTESDIELYVVIWTTTPWTLPANQAVCYRPDLDYVILRNTKSEKFYICGAKFVQKFKSFYGDSLETIITVKGSDFEGGTYHNPLSPDKEMPLLPGHHVAEDVGTGLVHTAPAHGQDDFKVALDNDIEILSLIDDVGCYTSDAGPKLQGLLVGKKADEAVISLLDEHLLHQEPFKHSYPYDWRTKEPVILRASKQWFVNLEHLKDKALEAYNNVKISPKSFENTMQTLVKSRTFWCISRQRVWGVPLPVFYHRKTHEPLVNRAIIDRVKSMILEHGSDAWWTMSTEDILTEDLLAKYGKGKAEDYVKGSDILDIWFDSGTSWAAVIPENRQADLYLEGLDQFRGWFQSSLLTSVATTSTVPYKKLLVHGFAVDEEGCKMSKSVGNVIDPDVVINGGKDRKKEPSYGVDVLRLWAAHYGLQDRVNIGPNVLNQTYEEVFQMRKILRLLLGNLFDFSEDTLSIPYNDLRPQDKYQLCLLHEFGTKVTEHYQESEFIKILLAVEYFINTSLSRFYINITKDRLYCSDKVGMERRACQYTLYHTLNVLTMCLAPILPHMTEEAYQHFPFTKEDSLFKARWFDLPEEWNNAEIVCMMRPVFEIQEKLLSTLETPVDFDVTIVCGDELYNILKAFQAEPVSSFSALTEMLGTSVTKVTQSPPLEPCEDTQVIGMDLSIQKADGTEVKEHCSLVYSDALNNLCERCRRYTATAANKPCDRCVAAMSSGWE